MYLLSLYFQDPSDARVQPPAGRDRHPAGHRRSRRRGASGAPARRGWAAARCRHRVPPHHSRFAVLGFVEPTWTYAAFVLPLIAVAVGMGLSNGPASSAATAWSREQVGSASGVSNMARYVGAAVATALAATIYGGVIATGPPGASAAEALASGLATTAVGDGRLQLRRRRRWPSSWAGTRPARGTLDDAAAAAAAHIHTLPTSATPTPAAPASATT